jgi:hypothetical protein
MIRYVWAVVLAFGAAGAAATVIALALSVDDPVVRTREVPQPGLTAKSNVADVRGRFVGKPDQSVPGTDLGLQGGTCELYVVSDGGVLVCHG